MTTSGPLYPGTRTQAASAPYSNNSWSSVTYMGGDDELYANIVSTTYDTNDWSYEVRLTNFGFAIPEGATINGITVEINGNGANGASSPQHVQLTKDGTAAVGDERGSTDSWANLFYTRTFGGSSDNWGTSWTDSEINASTFGVLFAEKATENDADIYINYIRVSVTYNEGGGSSFVSAWARNSNSILKVM